MEKGMNMQDKEFDDLFRSKLRDFEVQPSAEVWQNIDAELNGKKKKSIFPILGIAASVLILLIAGVLFIPKKGVVKHNKPDSNLVVKVNPSMVKPENNAKSANLSEKNQAQLAVVETPVKTSTQVNRPKIKVNTVEQKEQRSPSIIKSVKSEDQPLMASTGSQRQDETIKQGPIELTEVTTATVKQIDDNSAINLPAQPVLASNQPAKTTKPVIKKHGIRNFGDIVNLVVAKVDKRKDKLIQFSDTDDDESVVSAVHLGALKIKKDN